MVDQGRVTGLVKDSDLTRERLVELLGLAARLKVSPRASAHGLLAGRAIALVFEKPSTRTRAAFEIAAHSQGAHVSYFGPAASHLGVHESVADTAAVLGRLYDGIAYRGADDATVETLAKHADVPVWNALTESWHPTQALGDLLTITECGPKPWGDTRVVFVGDGRSNVANSLRVVGALLGMMVRVVAPRSMPGSAEVHEIVHRICLRTGACVEETDDLERGVSGADFVYADTWVRLDEPIESWRARVAHLRPYRIDSAVLAATKNPGVRFLHCLPAVHDNSTSVGAAVLAETGLRGAEVSDEVFHSSASLVFQQAENRMHAIKALLVADLTAGVACW